MGSAVRHRRDPPGPLNAAISAEVVRLRKAKGLSQEALGHLVGQTQGQMCNYEKGKRQWGAGLPVSRVAQVLGTTAGKILESAEAALKESDMERVLMSDGVIEGLVVSGEGNYLSDPVMVVVPLTFSRVGNRVDFSLKVRGEWSDGGHEGVMVVPLPLDTSNPDAANLVVSVTKEGTDFEVAGTHLRDTQAFGSPAKLSISLYADVAVTQSVLSIRGSYVIIP